MLRIGDLVGIYDNPNTHVLGVVTHIFKEWGGDLVEVYWMDGKRGDIQSSAIEVIDASR